jgi:ribonuclease HI
LPKHVTDCVVKVGLINGIDKLMEEIRKRAVNLNKKNWKIEFKWVKADAGIYGNEIEDRLAKEAT